MLRMRTGSISACPLALRDIHESKQRMREASAMHAVLGWYPTGCCSSGQ
jgi:hypothetical protein